MRKFLFLCLTMLFSLVTQGLWATDETDAKNFTGDYECVFIHATDDDGNTCMVSNEFYYEASAGETKKFNYADPLSGVTTGEGEEAVTTHYVTVNGVKLSTGLKMEGSTEIDFTITEEMGTMDLQIIIDTKSGNSNTPAIKVDSDTYSTLTQRSTDSSADDFGGYEITITLAPGDHTIKQGGSQDCLMYINLTKNETEETEPGPEVEYPVTATWDWQNDKPEGINATNIEGTTGTVASDVEGIELYVDASSGKLNAADRSGDAQFNSGTIIQVPVTSTSDVITVTSDAGDYHNYTVGGIAATDQTTTHTATAEEVEAGYVEIIATGQSYLQSIIAVLNGPDEEEGGDEGGSSVELLDEVEDGVYAIVKTDTWYAENGYSTWTADGNDYYKTYDADVIFFENDDITIATAVQTYVASKGNHIGDIQAVYPTYTGSINLGTKLSNTFEDTQTIEDLSAIDNGAYQGILKVTPAVDGTLEFDGYPGTNDRTIGIYDVATDSWVGIENINGSGSVSGEVEAEKEYLLIAGGNNTEIGQITFTPAEEEETEPGPTEGSSLDLYTEVEDNTYAITKEASWFAENGFDDWGSDQYSGTIDAGTVVYEDDIIKIETATDTYAGNFGNKASDMKADFPTYTGYTLSGTTLEVNFTDEVRIYDPSSIAANNQGVLMVTPTVDGELAFGVYAGDNKRTIGIYELATEEEIAAGTERAWVAINTFKHGGAEDEDSTDPTVEKGAPGYVSGSVTANRQYLLVGGSNKNLTLHQITFVPTEEEETEPGPVEEGLLYSTDFTDWETIDRTEANGDEVTVTTTTGGDLTFTLWGVGVDPTKTDSSKFPDYVGAMITSKYAEDGSAEYSVYEPFAVTSTLGTVDKIVFTQVATGNNRGIKVSVKGDGDEDWVVLYNETIHTASGETIELDGIDKTNCRIKFESFALAQNGYIADLKIYGTDFTGEEVDPYEDLYDEIRMDVDALGVDLTYAWANINLEHPESVEGLQSTYDAIKDEITNLQLVVEASHDGEELTADQASIEAQVEVIKAEIDALEAAATSINSITIDSNFEGKSIYTISGQKVAAPTKAGIYIIDGKKVVIK